MTGPLRIDVTPADVSAREHRRQFDHEHGKAYDAVEIAAQRLELAGSSHDREVGLLRAIRRRLARHIDDGSCDGD